MDTADNRPIRESTELPQRIESLESELAEVKAERDGYYKLLLRMLPEGDPTGWPTPDELVQMAANARPIQTTLDKLQPCMD